jgi:hypothetical protein
MPLALVLLLVGASAAHAQNISDGANSNNGNQNVNANRNTNGNVNANANGNGNSNRNGNTNTNTNTNAGQNANGNGNSNQETPAALRPEIRRDNLVNSGWYFPLMTFLFAALLIPFAMVIYRAIRFSKSTFNSPLGLPDGSLRAILAYTLVVFLGFYVYASIVSFSDFKPPEFLMGIVATVIGFYFGSRNNDVSSRGAGAPAQNGVVGGAVKDNTGTATQDATVVLTQEDGKKLTAKTNEAGKFEIKNVPAGEHSIQAAKAEHQSDQTKVTVKAGERQTVTLTLK